MIPIEKGQKKNKKKNNLQAESWMIRFRIEMALSLATSLQQLQITR